MVNLRFEPVSQMWQGNAPPLWYPLNHDDNQLTLKCLVETKTSRIRIESGSVLSQNLKGLACKLVYRCLGAGILTLTDTLQIQTLI